MPAISNITQIPFTSMLYYFMRKDNRLYNVEKAINLPLAMNANVLKGGMGESLHIFQVRYVFSCFVGKKKKKLLITKKLMA